MHEAHESICILNTSSIDIAKSRQAIMELVFSVFRLFCVYVEVLRPSQQLRSCRAGQLPINAIPGQA